MHRISRDRAQVLTDSSKLWPLDAECASQGRGWVVLLSLAANERNASFSFLPFFLKVKILSGFVSVSKSRH